MSPLTVYPMKYTPCFGVLCFVVVISIVSHGFMRFLSYSSSLLHWHWGNHHINGLVQERCNSSALALELHLSCTNPSILLQCQWSNHEGYEQNDPKKDLFAIIIPFQILLMLFQEILPDISVWHLGNSQWPWISCKSFISRSLKCSLYMWSFLPIWSIWLFCWYIWDGEVLIQMEWNRTTYTSNDSVEICQRVHHIFIGYNNDIDLCHYASKCLGDQVKYSQGVGNLAHQEIFNLLIIVLVHQQAQCRQASWIVTFKLPWAVDAYILCQS